ncbi:unnamed protein product, partial [Adineta steineri]|jgi:hypothetical protein
MLSTQ